MFRTRLLPAFATIIVVGGSSLAAQAAVQPIPIPTTSAHPFSAAQRDQMAFEAGIAPKQAEGLTIGQLGWLKEQRDEGRPWFAGPVHVDPAKVHS